LGSSLLQQEKGELIPNEQWMKMMKGRMIICQTKPKRFCLRMANMIDIIEGTDQFIKNFNRYSR
jgi:hypothetical protein